MTMFKNTVPEEDNWAREEESNKRLKKTAVCKARKTKWVSHRAHTGKSRNAYRILVGNPN
jgi:hypothetical protein